MAATHRFVVATLDFHNEEAAKLTSLQSLELEVDVWQRTNSHAPPAAPAAMKRDGITEMPLQPPPPPQQQPSASSALSTVGRGVLGEDSDGAQPSLGIVLTSKFSSINYSSERV